MILYADGNGDVGSKTTCKERGEGLSIQQKRKGVRTLIFSQLPHSYLFG
jgi:hypothetical protein